MTTALVDPTTAGAQTQARLLDAAERLFAERGIDAVSVRAVNAAAGANVAAVHYHFGSKERRLAMLSALPADRPPEVRAVVEALVVPLAELSADPAGSGRAYARVLATLHGGGPEMRARLGAAFAPQFAPFDHALARALPDLPVAVRHFRLNLAGTLVVQTLADRETAAAGLGLGSTDTPLGPADHDGVVAALVDTVTGALAAPVGPIPKGSRT